MRLKIVLTTLALILLAASRGMSQSATENFAYLPGQFLDSLGAADAAHGWGGPWMIDTSNAHFDSMCVIADTGFAYADLPYTTVPHVAGNATLSLPGGWAKSARYVRSLSQTWPDMQGQYWVSYLFDTKGDPSGDGGNSYFLFKLYSGDVYGTKTELVALGKGGGAINYSCGSGWPGSATAAGESATPNQGGPVWLVAMINMTGDAAQDASARIFMWINPDPSTAPDTNTADVKNNMDVSDGIGGVGLEAGGQDTIKLVYDEIRLGTSFSSVSSPLVSAAFHAQDLFKYPVGNLTGAGGVEDGWAGPWHLDPGDASVSDSVFWVVNSGIDYSGMNYDYSHSGNIVVATVDPPRYSRMERTLDKTWENAPGRVFWFSTFMYIKDDTNSSTWCGVKLATDQTDNAMMFGKAYGMDIYTVGGGYHGGPTDQPQEQSTTTWDAGPVWILGKLISDTASTSDTTYMWINPDPSAEPSPSTADAYSINFTLGKPFGFVRLEAGGGIPYEVYFSDMHLDTSFVNVITGIKQKFDNFVASVYKLSQNYPNPFNPTTTISYSVPKAGYVTLKVYNVLGQQVATLFSGRQAAGSHLATFDGSKLASGVYFYVLRAGNTQITKKLMLLK